MGAGGMNQFIAPLPKDPIRKTVGATEKKIFKGKNASIMTQPTQTINNWGSQSPYKIG